MSEKMVFRAFDFSDYDGMVRVSLCFDAETLKGTLRVEIAEGNGWTNTHELPFSACDFAE